MAEGNAGQFFKAFATASQAAGSYSAGVAERSRAGVESHSKEIQAINERAASAEQEQDFRKKQSSELGKRRAAMGASGTEMTGTPLLAFGDYAAETELQAQRIRESGNLRGSRLEQEADLNRLAGKSAMQRGVFRAGAALLTGAADRYDKPTTKIDKKGTAFFKKEPSNY